MKDTLRKPSPTPPLLPKSKLGTRKKNMAAKKGKEHKTPIMKVGRGKKVSKANKKAKLNKDTTEPTVRRKRGRPRNEDRLHVKKPVREQKNTKKNESKTGGRKRKLNLNVDIKIEKGLVSPPSKKSKNNDNCNNVNGDIKIALIANHKVEKEELSDVESTPPHAINSNGTLHSKKTSVFGQKKSPFNILKSATFHPPPKKELLNGNSSITSFKAQPVKNKYPFKKDSEINFLKDSDQNSKVEKISNVFAPFKGSKQPISNELFKYHTKDAPKFHSKEPLKSMFKEPAKCLTKEPVKSLPKDSVKIQSKESKAASKEPTKPLPKEPVKSQTKEVVKLTPKETPKPQTKEPTKPHTKTPIKQEFKPFPFKLHPHRMASLDALARMHVICTTDRRPPEPKHSSASGPFSQKSVTQCHERIQVDVKKETNDFKGNIVHKQEINLKQQVFVSHSVQQSSIVEHEQSKTVSTKVQLEAEKKKSKSLEKATNSKQMVKNKLKKSPSNVSKLAVVLPKSVKGKSKISKSKDVDKKSAKVPSKAVTKVAAKTIEKQDTKGTCKKTKKVEQTKSEVKVKETIRMHKTCTYQSVTTVNSHATANSSVVPVSHVGMTTNFSKTKKTVVTDEECKNKVNYSSGSVINNSYCLTTESPCSAGHTDCCKFHAHPQIIPLAHMQTCSLGHRTSDASPSHCDASFSMHRFGHQQPVIFSTPPPPDCGCCCSSSLVQNVQDSCLVHKSLVAYPHHLPSHHTHLSKAGFSAEPICSDCHPGNTTVDPQRHHVQHYTITSPSTHSRVAACCACCERQHRDSNQHHHQPSLQYLSEPKNSSLVPCEQTPLDLSLTSSASNISIESDISLPQGHCSSPICCSSRDLLLLRTSPHSSLQHKFSSGKPCCRCSKNIFETKAVDAVQSLSCSNNRKSIIKIGQRPQTDHVVSLLASPAAQVSIHPVASTSGVTNRSVIVPHLITDNSLVTTKLENSISPKQLSIVPKRCVFGHGWSWKGKPREKLIALSNDLLPCPRVCYPSVQHKEGDTISERDCVLLRSGPKDTDLPYVAKVAAFWENPEDGEMMMSLLWYYRPEHTDQGRKPGMMEDEVFASRHKDVNSVACIEDKCYVLTYNEYCRYKASMSMEDDMVSLASKMVPELPDGYSRRSRLPCDLATQDIVFFCNHVYDFRQKRILKNPT